VFERINFEEGEMRRFLVSIRLSTVFCSMLVLAVLIAARVPVTASQVQATVGAQSEDQGKQALAFLPNEIWIHVGESITWTFPTDEIHTVTFLKQNAAPQQVRLPRPGLPGGGCPGTTPDGSSFDGSTCVTSSELVSGQTYTVNFPTAGNFKFVCLVHADMTGAVHVLDLSEPLPHDQTFYDREARHERAQLLSDAARLEGRGTAIAERTSEEEVTAGISEVVAPTGGGKSGGLVVRFLPGTMVVHVGDTVEWTNLGPVTPHTVTFGIEPPEDQLMPPSSNVTVDLDGARHAVIGSPDDNVHSGFLVAATQERIGLAQSPLGVTRFRVTFTSPGTFNYICALHDDLGMVGKVIVHR
jgi:plastocyanin